MEIIKKSSSLGLQIVCVGVGKVGSEFTKYMANHSVLDVNLIMLDKELSAKNNEDLQALFSNADIVFTIVDFTHEREVSLYKIVEKMAKSAEAFNILLSPTFQRNKKVIESNTILMMPYQSVLPEDTNLYLSQVIKEIYALISPAEDDDINLDLVDIKAILDSQGVALISIGESNEQNSVIKAIKMAMDSLLAENISLGKATGAMMHFTVHPDMSLLDISDAVDILYEILDENADCMFGVSSDNSLDKKYVKVTMISKFCC